MTGVLHNICAAIYTGKDRREKKETKCRKDPESHRIKISTDNFAKGISVVTRLPM